MKRAGLFLLVAALGGAALTVACEDKPKKDPAPVASTTAAVSASATAAASASAAPSASASAAAATDDDAELASEEDFADEAEGSIDEKNFESELDKIEKEIAAK